MVLLEQIIEAECGFTISLIAGGSPTFLSAMYQGLRASWLFECIVLSKGASSEG